MVPSSFERGDAASQNLSSLGAVHHRSSLKQNFCWFELWPRSIAEKGFCQSAEILVRQKVTEFPLNWCCLGQLHVSQKKCRGIT